MGVGIGARCNSIGRADVSRLATWISRGAIASVSPTVELVSRFARTAVLSRVLVPEEFGSAVAISVVLSLSVVVTDVALDRFILIDATNRNAQIAAVHLLSIGRAILIAIALWFSAPTIASIFGVPQFSSSFAWAAVVPLLDGFSHFGIRQIQRTYNYLPESLAKLSSSILGFVAIFPAISVFGDHRAIIASFITEKVAFLIASHILAWEPYYLSSKKSTLLAALSFGLPLTLNGIGLTTFSQLDRFIVGHWFGVEALATYAVILNVGIIPTSLIAQIMGRLGISYLLLGGKRPSIDTDSYRLLVVLYFIVGVAYSLWVALTLDVLTPLIFGPVFIVTPPVHILVTAIAFFRLQRSGAPSTFLAAISRTRQLALINLLSGLGLVAAVLALVLKPRLESMLLGSLLGDISAVSLLFFVSSARITGRRGGLVFDFGIAIFATCLIVASIGWEPQFSLRARGVVFAVGLLSVSLQMFFAFLRYEHIRNLIFEGLRLTRSIRG